MLLRDRRMGVMARRRFVQRQRRDLVERALIEVRGVDDEASGKPLGEIPTARARGGIALLQVARHGLDREGLARQRAEPARQHPVDPLGRGAVLLDQFLAAACVEARIGAQEAQPLGEAALEAALRDDLVHLAADARHLGQAHRVDLLGGEVGGGVIAQQEVVIGASIGDRADAQPRAGLRPVAAVDIVQRRALRRAHLAIDHHTGLGDQRGPARERREQGIVGHRAGNLLAQHRHRHVDHAPRLGPAGGDAALEIGALFGEITGHAA